MECANLQPEQRPGRRWWWIMLAPVSLIALAGLGVVAVARSAHVRERGPDGLTVDLPGGQFRFRANRKLEPSAMGVPRYPGARRVSDGGGVALSWSSSDGLREQDFAVAGAEFTTHDNVDRVVEFYREQLPNWLVIEHKGKVRLELRDGGVKRMISIRSQDGETHIAVATAGTPESN